MAMLK